MQKKLNVLIVEDEAIIGLLLAETFENIGHSICAIAKSQAEAVALAAKCQPDLMVVDAGLSTGNGVAAVDAILATRYVPHVFVTGDARKVRALKPDAIILEKPFFIPDLVRAIEQALSTASG
jgi:two-component system, response regulator PdtaR